MAEDLRLICAGGDVYESGKGVRFTVQRHDREAPAFVIRHGGQLTPI